MRDSSAAIEVARKAIDGVAFRPSRNMAIRDVLAEHACCDYSTRVLRRYLRLSRAKRQAGVIVSVGGREVRVSRWGA